MIFNLEAGGGKATITYTGTHTTEPYTADGKAYTLYKITGSGTLNVKGKAKGVDIWLCGGGANGDSSGGAGAYCSQLDNADLKGDYAITIGAAGGATTFGSLLSVAAVSGKNGGTGGGSGDYWSRTGGTGDGKNKYPFGDTTNFDPHCAGGGGGSGQYYTGNYDEYNDNSRQGGKGGTNGGSGGRASTGVYSWNNAAGGNKGGGTGGAKRSGSAATFYGSGGGGGGCDGDRYSYVEGIGFRNNKYYSDGAGYQGIVYVCVPA